MKKRKWALLLAVWLVLSSIVPAWAADTAVLTIEPDVTEAVAGDKPVQILYTITVTPPPSREVGVFSFQLHPSGQMTLPDAFTADGQTLIAYSDSGLAYDGVTGKGVFSTYEYTPASAFFAAVGSTAERRMTGKAQIMTIRATVPAGVSGAFVLDADFTIAPDGSGVTYVPQVDTTSVIIAAAPKAPGDTSSGSAVAVTGLAVPSAGASPDFSITVNSSLPTAPAAAVTWLCDGQQMTDAVFAPGHIYTVTIAVTAASGVFDDPITANEGYVVRRIDETHIELSRSFHVEEYYTEAAGPGETEIIAPSIEAEVQTATATNAPPASDDAAAEGQSGTMAVLIVLAVAAVALGAVQVLVPGGVNTLLRGRKKKEEV